MAFTVSGCCRLCRQPISTTIVPSCPPVVLVEPMAPVRPDVIMRYKIEDGKEWFILDRDGYIEIRDYLIQMEGALDFATQEIVTSNKLQSIE